MKALSTLLSRALSVFVAGLNSIGSVWIFALMALINVDVFSRFLFNAPVDGVPEIVELSIVGIVFLQLGDAVQAGRLTRSDGLYSKLLKSHPKVGHVLGALFDLAGALFFVAILYGAFPRLIDAYQRGYYTGNKDVFAVAVWPIRLILVIGCVTVILVFLRFAWQHLTTPTSGRRESS